MSLTPEPAKDSTRLDRRIVRTRQALRKALFELIQEKSYDTVSVEDITQRANLGRATFYLHYKDKDDLLLEEFVDIAQERVRVLSEVPFSDWEAGERAAGQSNDKQPIMPLLKIFEHAAANASLYRALLHGENLPRMEARIRALVATSIAQIAEAKRQPAPDLLPPQIPVDLLAAYFSGALLSSLTWWLDSPAPVTPIEMAGMFQRLFFLGVWKMVGR